MSSPETNWYMIFSYSLLFYRSLDTGHCHVVQCWETRHTQFLNRIYTAGYLNYSINTLRTTTCYYWPICCNNFLVIVSLLGPITRGISYLQTWFKFVIAFSQPVKRNPNVCSQLCNMKKLVYSFMGGWRRRNWTISWSDLPVPITFVLSRPQTYAICRSNAPFQIKPILCQIKIGLSGIVIIQISTESGQIKFIHYHLEFALCLSESLRDRYSLSSIFTFP